MPFQLTQRADFFEEEVGLETTLKRPIVNTRDEPHSDAQKYRRLHVIVGDANMAEVSTFLKVGTTAFVLSMVEDDFLTRDFVFKAPVWAMRHVSYDLSLQLPLELVGRVDDHRARRTVGVLRPGPQVRRGVRARMRSARRPVKRCLRRWEQVLTALETDPMSLSDQLDWVAKYRLINGYRERHDLAWDDARLAAMDLQYHDLRPEKSLADRVGLERLTDDDEVDPGHHRAAARHQGVLPGQVPAEVGRRHRGRQLGQLGLRHRPGSTSSGADDGTLPRNRGPRGYLLAECETSAELLDRLGS